MTRDTDANSPYLSRSRQCDRLLGAFYHDLGNVVLPSRTPIRAADADQDRALATLQRQSAAVTDHLLTVRAAAHAFRARGRDTAPRLPAGDWWGMSARLLRAMLTTGPPIRLTVDPDIDEVDVHAARVGRPLMLALIAIDVRYEICGPVLLHLDCTQSSARFSSEEPRPPARRPWPAMFVTDLASEDASIAAPASDDADSDDAGSDLLTITMPPEAMRPAASRAADTAPS